MIYGVARSGWLCCCALRYAMDKILITAIILFLLILVSSAAEPSKEVKKLDKELSTYRYEAKQTVIVGSVNKTAIENSVNTKVVEAKKSGNCVELAVETVKLAEKSNLKAEYKLEPQHVTVKVTDINGASWRYSNGKRTGRCW